MNNIKKSDLKFGNYKEVEALKTIQNKFSNCLKKVRDNYFVFDYSCDNCYVELKSRRNTHDKYPDTMVGKNKIDFAEKSDRPVYFCFSFTDDCNSFLPLMIFVLEYSFLTYLSS